MSEHDSEPSAEPRPGTRDIYDVLGVASSVSPIVAQAIYWARISELRAEEQAGGKGHGTSGRGKRVRRFVARVAARGKARVFSGSCRFAKTLE